MNDKVMCEKCGTEMIPVDSCKPVGMICPNCGWGWATTYIDPLQDDDTLYTVSLSEGNQASKAVIKAVSRISNKNFIQAKKMIENAPADVFVGRAVQVKNVLILLESMSLAYHVIPAFPHSLSLEADNKEC